MAAELRRLLARSLLEVQVGDRLPAIRQLAALYGVSLGAAQGALAGLEKSGAVAIQRRGRLGAFLLERSVGQLWSIAQDGPLVIALPLPSTRRCEGLASGIKAVLAKSGIEAFCIFFRGSRRRLRALQQQRCHAAVISGFAAAELCGPNEKPALELPPQTYSREHRVFYTTHAPPPHRPLRVALDSDSADLQRLTEMEFAGAPAGAPVEFVPATYLQYAWMLEEGRADAAVWDVDETVGRLAPSVPSRPLSERVLRRIGDSNTRATFVVNRADTAAGAVIAECLRDPELLEIQRQVIAGNRLPEY